MCESLNACLSLLDFYGKKKSEEMNLDLLLLVCTQLVNYYRYPVICRLYKKKQIQFEIMQSDLNALKRAITTIV